MWNIFLETLDYMFFTGKSTREYSNNFIELYDIEPLSIYINSLDMDTYNYEFKEKFNYIIRAHKECLIHIYKDLINNITDDKIYEVIYHMVNCLIVNYDDKMIKYLFNHNIFIDKYFLNTDTFNIVENMKKIYPEKDTLIKYNNYSVITKKFS